MSHLRRALHRSRASKVPTVSLRRTGARVTAACVGCGLYTVGPDRTARGGSGAYARGAARGGSGSASGSGAGGAGGGVMAGGSGGGAGLAAGRAASGGRAVNTCWQRVHWTAEPSGASSASSSS
ncbi:hypothetical protein PSR1_04179 [Anaeromyxobacter sp. PSR-1]|nr:hypothetical protein PSR1_04179 [Anaeromyxobacter sp. PSR-1]